MIHYDTIIIGAGVAGCSAAYFLHKAGQKVLIIDKCGVATGGSGAAGAFVSPKIGAELPLKKLSDEAFGFAVDFYKQNFQNYFHQTTIVRIPKTKYEYDSLHKFSSPHKQYNLTIDELLCRGIKSKFDSTEFSEAGVCDAKELCSAMADGVELIIENIENIEYKNELWHIGDFKSTNIILATGYENDLIDVKYMSIEGIWGNRADFSSSLPQKCSFHESFSASANIGGVIKLGATHEPEIKAPIECSIKSANYLLAKASGFIDTSDFIQREMFCGMRASNRDYTPVVGNIIDVKSMLNCPNILNGRKYSLIYHKNLYIFNALGARGFVFAPYLANQLANHIANGDHIDERVNPDRLFYNWIRKVK